jgi:hypothetical protein
MDGLVGLLLVLAGLPAYYLGRATRSRRRMDDAND